MSEPFDHLGLQRAIAMRMQHLGKNELACFSSAGVTLVDAAVGALATIGRKQLAAFGSGFEDPQDTPRWTGDPAHDTTGIGFIRLACEPR